MKYVFEMTDLDLMTYFFGMKISQNKNEIFICWKKYAKEILKKAWRMQNNEHSYESKGEVHKGGWGWWSSFLNSDWIYNVFYIYKALYLILSEFDVKIHPLY